MPPCFGSSSSPITTPPLRAPSAAARRDTAPRQPRRRTTRGPRCATIETPRDCDGASDVFQVLMWRARATTPLLPTAPAARGRSRVLHDTAGRTADAGRA
ncbi:MAG: hypothetical protein ACRCYZ_06760, partial [Alphaproteobacteria bacterium]